MKYVIFKYNSMFIPAILPEHATHSEIKISGATPVSAGFCHLSKGFLVVDPERGSDSLGLKSNVSDMYLLTAVLCGAPVSNYLDLNELDATNDEQKQG